MEEARDIAARIDEMTLAEFLRKTGNADMPERGGDYDTKEGWADRMGVVRNSQLFKDTFDALYDAGLIDPVRGRVPRGNKWYTTTLWHSPKLAGLINRSESPTAE